MSTAKPTCSTCGAALPNGAMNGHCPVCLFDLGTRERVSSGRGPNGEIFGQYELLELVGKGGMGIVYKARHQVLRRTVAIKMLGPYAAAFPAISQRLRLEAEAAAVLHHPGIVSVYEAGEQDGRPYISMEFIDGMSLANFIGPYGYEPANGESETDRDVLIARLVARIARAVDYAHKHGVLHRDLKPANIVLDAGGEPHLTDFGVAKVLHGATSHGTATGEIMGTPSYMAPELASAGAKAATTASDIYSLGVILYELLTGRPPFRADSPVQLLRIVLEQDAPPPHHFNKAAAADLCVICLKCLEKKPQHRYRAASDLADDIDRWLRGEPIEARPVRLGEKVWRWARRQPVLAALSLAFVALLIVAVGLSVKLFQHKSRQVQQSAHQASGQRNTILLRVEQDWKAKQPDNLVPIYFRKDDLAALAPRQITGGEMPIPIGLLPETMQGVKFLEGISALDNYVHSDVRLSPDRPTALEVYVYHSKASILAGFKTTNVVAIRADPAIYVLARKLQPDVTPLVREVNAFGRDMEVAALFTLESSPIRNLEQLRGNSIALGPADTALGTFLPKAEMVSAGIHARDLISITNVTSTEAIRQVLRTNYVAGVALVRDIERFTGKGPRLRIIKELRSPGNVWATTGTPGKAAWALKNSLLKLKDEKVLQPFDYSLGGFIDVSPADFADVEAAMKKAEEFDR